MRYFYVERSSSIVALICSCTESRNVGLMNDSPLTTSSLLFRPNADNTGRAGRDVTGRSDAFAPRLHARRCPIRLNDNAPELEAISEFVVGGQFQPIIALFRIER